VLVRSISNTIVTYTTSLFNLLMIEFTTGVAFLMSSMYGIGAPTVATAVDATATSTSTDKVAEKVVLQDRKSVEKYLREKYADTPILVEIARCESTFSQFDKNGNVVRGIVNNQDVGVMQINEKYHASTALALGHDLYTIEGNTDYAKHLYLEQGAAPWKASQKCWSKS
jgi:hypothetical protein